MKKPSISHNDFWDQIAQSVASERVPDHARSATQLAEQWECAELTARKRANSLVEQGKLRAIKGRRGSATGTFYLPAN